MSDVAYLKSLLGQHQGTRTGMPGNGLGINRTGLNFPQKGILFLDIFPILQDPLAHEVSLISLELAQHTSRCNRWSNPRAPRGCPPISSRRLQAHALPFVQTLITHFMNHITSHTLPTLRASTSNPSAKIDAIVGLDARGFLFGPVLALRLGAAFVPVRKAGKLPGKCFKASYEKERMQDSFEMQEGAIKPGQNVLVIDDLIATGGSAKAAGELVEKSGAKVVENLFVVEIEFLKGKDALSAPTYSIVKD
ncbi:SPOSA6832_04691, partial [Sporobolomyces salmonicolor]